MYCKLGIFVFSAWAGPHPGSIIAGLAISGVLLAATSVACDLMFDFRTAFLTCTPPSDMFLAQLLGTLSGAVVAPLMFFLFWSAFDIGAPGSDYPAPYATLYRSMAVLGAHGLQLPRHAAAMCIALFVCALGLNLLRDFCVPKRYAWLVPIPTALAIPFYVGASVGIDVAVGAGIRYLWDLRSMESAKQLVPAVASGLIAGESLFAIPSALLALARIQPPICMSFN